MTFVRPTITLALFDNWHKFLAIGAPFVIGNSIYRRFSTETDTNFFSILTDSAWHYFNCLSIIMGGAIMIDHLSLLEK
ncbi:MAG: hypothetical protein WD512_18830 [Candidatus Paceibacterota bacterium]